MHIPRYNQEKDWQRISAFIKENSFGILVNVSNGVPLATHIPIELEEKPGGTAVLRGHVARQNPQWEAFASGTALAIFTDPHAYISSSWYEKEKIPTWNYIAVHVYGQLRLLSEAELLDSLSKLMHRYEAASARPVSMNDIPEKELHNNLKAIVGFEMNISDVQARFKLSQNRNAHDYESVITHLKERGDEGSLKIAAEMTKRKSKIQGPDSKHLE